MAKKYEIVKFYQTNEKLPYVVQRNYSLEEARAYCDDPESSSMTAKPPKGCGGDQAKILKWHELQKHWFLGYREQM